MRHTTSDLLLWQKARTKICEKQKASKSINQYLYTR